MVNLILEILSKVDSLTVRGVEDAAKIVEIHNMLIKLREATQKEAESAAE